MSRPPADHSPAGSKQPKQVGPIDNKPLIIGLLVIVSILTIVIIWQVVNARAASANQQQGHAPGPPHNQGGPGPTGQTPPPPTQHSSVSERISSNLTARARTAPRVAGNVARQHSGVTHADNRHMATIAEAAEENAEDAEAHTEARNAIAAALAKSDEEDRLALGSELVVGADVAARAELAAETAPLPVRNETLMEHSMAEPEPEDDELAACSVIMTSGRRSGQICGRRCAPGQAACATHSRSAKKI